MSDVALVECRRCQVDVPAGNFCGICGCHPADEPHPGLWWRPKVFGAAPAEGVLRPALASSLFPHLPDSARAPFRATLVIGAAALLVSAVLRLPALGIALSTLGLPLLFVFYLRASAADRDLPRVSLTLAAALGAVLGVGWVLASGHIVSRTYGVPMYVGLAMHHVLRAGILIPLAGMVLMLLPVLWIRWRRPGSRESLDGFIVGALAALMFSSAATMTRLAPQVVTGLIAHARPVRGLMIEVVLCGAMIPITAAAAGGMAGIALWFREPAAKHQGRVRLVLLLLAAAALLAHAALGAIEIIGMKQTTMLAAHVGLLILLLLGLRTSLQLALLHEAADPMHEDQPLLCPHCETVVPDMAFCTACGGATRASSQESRRERRTPAEGTPETVYPGYALPEASYLAPTLRWPLLSWLISRCGIGVAAGAVALGAAALVFTPKIAHYMCPPECGKPPTGTPVMALPRFEAPDGAFSVSYPSPEAAYTVTTRDNGVTAQLTIGDGGVLQLFSEPARGRTAKEVTRALVKRTYPEAKLAYEIPNAMVGYQPGYGEVADDWPQSGSSSFSRVRILVLTAVKNDVALVAFATGPYHAFGPDFGPGPPSGANLQIAQDMGKYVNSFHWQGDPVR